MREQESKDQKKVLPWATASKEDQYENGRNNEGCKTQNKKWGYSNVKSKTEDRFIVLPTELQLFEKVI